MVASSASNPPSRGSGAYQREGTPNSSSSGGGKTYGKHEVPMLNVEQAENDGGERREAIEGGRAEAATDLAKTWPALTTGNSSAGGNRTKNAEIGGESQNLLGLATKPALSQSRSIPSLLLYSPADSPVSQRRALPPSGIKLPQPPPSLLNGIPAKMPQKSVSALNLSSNAPTTVAAVTPSAGKSDHLRESVNFTQESTRQMLLLAASNNSKKAAQARGNVGGGASKRLPPLQLPKMPLGVENDLKRKYGNGNGDGTMMEPEQDHGHINHTNTNKHTRTSSTETGENVSDGNGPIATMASGPMPQLKPLEPLKMPIHPSPILPASLPSPPLSPISTVRPSSNVSTVAAYPARVPPLHPIPNEVPFRPPTHRRSSSAGHLPSSNGNKETGGGGFGTMPLNAHKPLPAISEPLGMKKSSSSTSTSFSLFKKLHQKSRGRPWHFAFKCVLVSLFLCIPVVIFILMLVFSGGSNNDSTTSKNGTAITALPDSLASPTAAPPPPAPTPINIVGGAIFAPISMQNETAI